MPSIQQRRRQRLATFAARTTTGVVPSGGGPLVISDLHAYPLREPVSRRTYTIIKVKTSSGLAGYGETPRVTQEELASVGEAIRSRQATEIEVIRKELASMPRLRAAVNMALLDIIGKFTNSPLYQVLGGPTRHKARALACLKGVTDEELVAKCKQAGEAGFRAFSVPMPPVKRPNQRRELIAATCRRLEVLRATMGEEMDFVLDGAGAFTLLDASNLGIAFERFHLLWFDEPCSLSNLEAVRKLAAISVTPLGYGSKIQETGIFQDLLREGLIDILRPDLTLNGISEIRRLAAIAETYYVAVAPRHQGGPVATASALHLAASIPNFFIQQIPWPEAEEDRRMRMEIAGPGVETIKDGFAMLPAGPGLGTTVNEEAMEKYKES